MGPLGANEPSNPDSIWGTTLPLILRSYLSCKNDSYAPLSCLIWCFIDSISPSEPKKDKRQRHKHNNNKSRDSEAGNTNSLFSTFCDYRNVETFWTLKKAGWHHHLLLNFLSFFFFICLAITTDDIARHWESSCKAWETAMTNQVMRHGVTRRRGTLMALPLLHTRAHTLRHSRMHTHTCTENRKKHCESRKRSKGRGQGWQEHKADESNEISFFKSKCKMNYWRYLFMSTTTNMLVYQNPSSIFEYEQLEDNTPLRVRKLVLQRKRSRWLS